VQTINWRDILRMMFVRDWPWKALSLAIACMIYFSIRAQISHLRTVSVPVDVAFAVADTGFAIESVEPRSAQVTLRGSYSALNQLNPENMLFDINPKPRRNAAAQKDSETVKLSAFQLRNANGLRIVDIEPKRVLVKFDVPMNLTLGVARPELTGAARGQVRLSYDQTNAVVTGSRRLLATLAPDKVQVLSSPINVEGRTMSFQTRVALYPPDHPTRLKVTPSEMVVEVQITSEKTSARIERVPVHVLPAAAGGAPWVCSPPHVELEVAGGAEEVAHLGPEDFSVIANTMHLDPSPTAGKQIVTLTVLVRQGTAVTASAVPGSVELQILSSPEQDP